MKATEVNFYSDFIFLSGRDAKPTAGSGCEGGRGEAGRGTVWRRKGAKERVYEMYDTGNELKGRGKRERNGKGREGMREARRWLVEGGDGDRTAQERG